MHTLSAVAIRLASPSSGFQRSTTAPHHQNTAPKSQPPNPRRETFADNVEETTRKNVSAAKKIARDARKLPEIRVKSDCAKRQF
jgi:hypothetical protein